MSAETIVQIKQLQGSTQDRNLAIYGAAVPLRKAQMPGEGVTELHPDDVKAMEEREELKRKRQEFKALAFSSGAPSFQGDIEPNGGYNMTGQAGELAEGLVIEINPELKRTA